MIKSKKSCVKRFHLVTDDGLYDQKAFYTVKIVFYSCTINIWWVSGFYRSWSVFISLYCTYSSPIFLTNVYSKEYISIY